MVGGQIGHHRDIGADVHGHELERGELQHDHVVGLHVGRLGQEGLADVAAHIDIVARLFQELRDNGRGGGLPVAAGDADDFAGADLEEDLHLRGNEAPPLPGRLELGHVGPQAGRSEDDVVVQSLQIAAPKPGLRAQALQLLYEPAEGLPRVSVAGGDRDVRAQQHFNQGRVGHADADDGHPLAPQRVQIFLYCGIHLNSPFDKCN